MAKSKQDQLKEQAAQLQAEASETGVTVTQPVAAAAQPDSTPVSTGFAATRENVELLKTTLAGQDVKLTDAELQLTIYQAQRTGLDPLSRQIYPLKNKGRLTFITAIDGYRLIAQRTGEYRGQMGPYWCGKDGKWMEVWLGDGQPAAAKVGVLREGHTEPVWGVARFSSYGKTTGQWPTMGDVMIAKCAEALALRKAFPQELNGVYTQEEMDQAQADAAPPKPERSAAELLKDASDALQTQGIDDKDDRKAIILGLADVDDVSKLTGNLIKKALTGIADIKIEVLKQRYLTIEGDGMVNDDEPLDTAGAFSEEELAAAVGGDTPPAQEQPPKKAPKPQAKK